MNDEQLKEMAAIAKNNWLFDEHTDLDGNIARGLDYILAPGEYEEEVIDANVTGEQDWDGLERWSEYLGEQWSEYLGEQWSEYMGQK